MNEDAVEETPVEDEAEAPVEEESPVEAEGVKYRLNQDDVVKLTEFVLDEIEPMIQSIETKAELRNLLGRCLSQIVVVNLRDLFEAGKINF